MRPVRDPPHAGAGRRLLAQRRLGGRSAVIYDTVSYTVTKHAAIGFSEWLTAVYDDQGIGVSVLCPAAVTTPIIAGKEDTPEGRGAVSTDELDEVKCRHPIRASRQRREVPRPRVDQGLRGRDSATRPAPCQA